MNSKVIERVVTIGSALEVHFEDLKKIKFEECWLRDHCRCVSCYHADTFQRAKHLLQIPDATIINVEHDETQVIVKWSDEHESTYTSEFLSQFDYKTWKEGRRLRPILWRGSKVSEKIAKIHVDKFLKSVEGQKFVFQSLLDYGVALIEGVEPSLEATEIVCKALGGVQHTIFGGMWQFTTKAVHADTAYTNLPLAVHNDNTYFTEAAGNEVVSHKYVRNDGTIKQITRFVKTIENLQKRKLESQKKYSLNGTQNVTILHCIEHTNGVGGETILVDGFYGANCLKEDHPEDFEFLTTFDVEAEYIEEGHHHAFSAPVIQIDKKTQDLKQIRFNVYDRSAMAFRNSHDCKLYYRSLRNLSRYYEDTESQWQFKLTPGTVMVMDNFRVLHGRTGFSGIRVLCGSYVARSDWMDRARSLKLIQ